MPFCSNSGYQEPLSVLSFSCMPKFFVPSNSSRASSLLLQSLFLHTVWCELASQPITRLSPLASRFLMRSWPPGAVCILSITRKVSWVDHNLYHDTFFTTIVDYDRGQILSTMLSPYIRSYLTPQLRNLEVFPLCNHCPCTILSVFAALNCA